MFFCIGFGPKAARSLAHCLVALILLPYNFHPTFDIIVIYDLFLYEGSTVPLPLGLMLLPISTIDRHDNRSNQ